MMKSYMEGYLKVSEIHQIYYSQYGNPHGEPVVWLHGGPGSGCHGDEAKFFDLNYFRVILFDQRGAGKSKPFCELKENTTQNCVSDLEGLRNHLGIERWGMVGGSWGSLLALCYAITYPERVKGLVLRGVFLGTDRESSNIWYGMRDTFPEAWQEFVEFLPPQERDDISGSYRERILNSDPQISLPAIDAFDKYDCICSSHQITGKCLGDSLENQTAKIGCAKLFCHYEEERFFLPPYYVVDHLHRIRHLPCFIVHGRYDTICKVSVAYDLYQLWGGKCSPSNCSSWWTYHCRESNVGGFKHHD